MTLDWEATRWIIVLIVGGILLAGLIVILARYNSRDKDPHASVIRSWIAIALVLGLLVLSAATFAIDDATLRSTLIGGLTASAGGAIAYYFSSKSADQARQDLVAAAFGKEHVPDLTGKTVDQAKNILGGTTLRLSQDNAPADSTAPIMTQLPPADTDTVKGSTIKVTYATKKVKVPAIISLTAAQGAAALTKVGLKLSGSTPAPNETATIATQDPPVDSEQWEGTEITVTYG